MAVSQDGFERYASPNELRTIAREDLGFYHAVVVGCVYSLPNSVPGALPASLYSAIRACVEEHAFLQVVVGDSNTDKPFYRRVKSIDLSKHVHMVETDPKLDQWTAMENTVGPDLDRPFAHDQPPWRLTCQRLHTSELFISFAFSHALGDGMSGLAFHRSLLRALRSTEGSESPVSSSIASSSNAELPSPFDTSERLRISWSFLLRPFIAVYAPGWLRTLLNLKAQASTISATTWTGPPISTTPTRSKLRVRTVKAEQLQTLLRQGKKHGARLTGLFDELIARALGRAILDPRIDNFVSQIAVNMRGSIGVSNDVMGLYVSGCYVSHAKTSDPPGKFTELQWASARESTLSLAHTASTLEDQPIGLLRYLPSVRKWTSSKDGQTRDSSIELSNLGSFDPGVQEPDGSAQIRSALFAQPGHVLSSPIAFNLVSTKGGDLVYTVAWPAGALGIEKDEEDGFVDSLCDDLDAEIAQLGR